MSTVDVPREPFEACADGVVARLLVEFGPDVDRAHLERVVLGCCRDLRGVPLGAMPELVERLARMRVAGAVPDPGTGPDPGTEGAGPPTA